MRLLEKVFLCATVGALAHAGRLAELYNLLTASTGLQIVFLFLDSVERLNSASCKNAGKISELFGICQSNRRPGSMSPRGPRLT